MSYKKQKKVPGWRAFHPFPLNSHPFSSIIKYVLRYLGHCFWRETLINLHYSSLFPPLCLFPNHPLSPFISYKWASISLQLHTHSQRPLSTAPLQGIWFFNEDSNNDYGYFKTIWGGPVLLWRQKLQSPGSKGPIRGEWILESKSKICIVDW